MDTTANTDQASALINPHRINLSSNSKTNAFEFEQKLVQVSFNEALRYHAIHQSNFDLSILLEEFYTWSDRFNAEFDLNISPSAIAVEDLKNRKVLGSYRPRSGLGLDDVITLNVKHLSRSPVDLLMTLLHEQLHQWQVQHGTPAKASWYHNLEYTNMAASLGIFVNEKGQSLGYDAKGRFAMFLRQHGIDSSSESDARFWKNCGVDLVVETGTEALTILTSNMQKSWKNKKWTCGCTNIRAAVEVHAMCTKPGCGNTFVRA